MASPPFTGFPFPNPPPPPPPPFFPPPTLQASPNSNHHTTTVLFIVFVSFGSLLLFGASCFACWCLINKKKKKKRVQETKDVDVDEHFKVEELVVPGRHGPRIEMLSVEEEMNIHEHMRKNEMDEVEKGLRGVGGATAKEASGSGIDGGRGDARSSP